MNVQVFTIADAATVSGGKLNMLGSFDQIGADQFPSEHRECVVICKLAMEHEDSGEHTLSLHIIDPDGKDVLPSCGGSFRRQIEMDEHFQEIHLWNIRGFPLPRPGTFYLDAILDGHLIARTPLQVRQIGSSGKE